MNIVAIIPARGGYDKVPYLNIKKLGALPLIAYTLIEAAKSKHISRIIVSTDDTRIAEIAKGYGAEVPFMRPARLTDTNVKSVVEHAVNYLEDTEGYKPDILVILQATSPFRTAAQIDEAITKLLEPNAYDSVISVQEEHVLAWQQNPGDHLFYLSNSERRGTIDPLYIENGAIRVIWREVLQSCKRLGDNIAIIPLDKHSAFTVHDIYDFWLAERMLRTPRILFRVDGGAGIGMGHVYRSLAVADEIKAISPTADILFLMTAEPAEGVQMVAQKGYPVRVVSFNNGVIYEIQEYVPNVIVNDFPAPIEKGYLAQLAQLGASTINLVNCVDDLESPNEAASVIISMLYDNQLDLDTVYSGPSFAILRESFAGHKKRIRKHPKNVTISFGGSDPQGLTLAVLEALDGQLPPSKITVNVVLGVAFGYHKELEELVNRVKLRVHVMKNVENMADVLADADVVFCSGGMTVFELAALSTPGIVIAQNVREDQRMLEFSKAGSIMYLGHNAVPAEGYIRQVTMDLLADYEKRKQMATAGRALVDGQGTKRAAKLVLDNIKGD